MGRKFFIKKYDNKGTAIVVDEGELTELYTKTFSTIGRLMLKSDKVNHIGHPIEFTYNLKSWE